MQIQHPQPCLCGVTDGRHADIDGDPGSSPGTGRRWLMRDGLRSQRPMDNYSYELYTDMEDKIMGMHKHGKDSAKAKACKKYADENRLAKNKARRAENRQKWLANKRAS